MFDIELAELDPDKLVEHVAALEPTLGGVNLEDIKAPECFYVEQKLRERLNIPVFHDDQHGTAIISAAAVLNGVKIVGKELGEIKLVCSGAGAAAIACLDVFVGLGVKRQNIYVADSKGVIYEGREANMEPNKARYAQNTKARTLGDIIDGADVFLGCSTAGVLTKDMVKTMAARPLILALANPDPEITPADAKAARPDCIIATGRSDYPNQVNNVLCFPFIFRGALDVGATKITEGDEARVRARDRRARPGRAVGHRRDGLRRAGSRVRARLHHPAAVRPAADPETRTGGGEGGDGLRRSDASDRRPRRLPRAAELVRLPLGAHHEPGVRTPRRSRRSA